ncbi:ATP-binding protein [Streptomyces polygonati]|uniref:ATP-binding protein n=1 Tax=Streptomyces polygonati TaxID=1617087 RepID=A0ABV8HIH6_9ACTN
MTERRPFGTLLRDLRQRARWTMEELAEASGVSARAISDMERGHSRTPQQRTLTALAKALRLSPADHAALVEAARSGREWVPSQLPPDLRGFCGRQAELDRALSLLDRVGARPQHVVIGAVGGMAGIGKTTLAVHWAHRLAGDFPDGQLYVNLRGFDPAATVMDPADALTGFLTALGVTPHELPATVEGKSELLRAKLDGRRVLLVLDNARDSDQVRPLLPRTPTCLTIVTSRNKLTGLSVVEEAVPILLDVWTREEAVHALGLRIGQERCAAEPAAAARIVELCGRLPLAVALVAARLDSAPRLTLEAVARELRELEGGLEAFTDADTMDVRAAFSWSYTALAADTARLFRLLSVHPGPETSLHAAASLAGETPVHTRRRLRELVHANLLSETPDGHYTLHDLVRAYAGELAHGEDSTLAGNPDDTRQEAFRRLLDHYLHTARDVNDTLGHSMTIILDLPAPTEGTVVTEITTRDQAVDWRAMEFPALAAVQQATMNAGLYEQAWQLGWTVKHYLPVRGHWHSTVEIMERASQAARTARAEPKYAAELRRQLAAFYAHLGQHEKAEQILLALLDEHAASHTETARTHHALGYINNLRGDHRAALGYGRQAVLASRADGDPATEARDLNVMGWCHIALGEYAEGRARCEEALSLLAPDDLLGNANTWDTLGYAQHHLGEFDEAVHSYRRSLDFFGRTGWGHVEAEVHDHLAETLHRLGRTAEARAAWTTALALHPDENNPQVKAIHAHLAALDQLSASADPMTNQRSEP